MQTALYGISYGSSLFAKVPFYQYPECEGLRMIYVVYVKLPISEVFFTSNLKNVIDNINL